MKESKGIDERKLEKKMLKETSLGERGMSTVEVILILVVLVALVLIFKDQITALVENIFESINKTAASIY